MKKIKPTFVVPPEEFAALRDGTSHLFQIPLTVENLSFLPPAYEDATGTMLIFPVKECPEEFRFRTEGSRKIVKRKVVNVIAYKEDDGSEIIKVRLK